MARRARHRNRAFASGQSLLRLTVVDSAAAEPLGGVRVRLVSRGEQNGPAVSA